MRSLKLSSLLLFCTVLSLFLASCQTATPRPQETPVAPTGAPTEAEPATPQPTATETPVPARTLVACLSSEPESLYVYGGNSRSMWSVLEAIYDGPFDTRGYAAQAVILQKIPSLADGDAVIRPVAVKEGETILDASGNLVALKAGVRLQPSGCTSADCVTAWDGQSEVSMDQLTVSFKLLPGLKWSDGSPLVAEDSAFSYTIAADPATPSSKYLTDRTSSYKALDEQTVEWVGLPGFFEQRYGTFFWLPLPKHALGSKSAGQLLTDSSVARSPLGWGPYTIQEWVAGDHITLQKNPNYFRAAEGLPKFDTLVFRFAGEAADGNMNGLLAGECDVVDQNPGFLEMVPGLVQREGENKLKMFVGQGPEWEHLDFGVRPASYEDGNVAADGDRPDFFGDARTRQAFAYCTDRAAIVKDILFNRSSVPNSFLPAAHPFAQPDLPGYAFNPDQGQKLLDEVGWKDIDNNPATPRVAAGVSGVPDGTALSVTYLTTQAALRQQAAQAAAASLQRCGIEVKVQAMNPGELFAPGPEGPVFGRKFDLVQFSWEASARPNCLLYASSQVPGSANQWIGANVSGYASQEFDAACAAAYWSKPTDPDYAARNKQVQELFAKDLPVLPLYSHVKIAIARPDLCGFDLDVTARSIFWNLEALDYEVAGGCK